MYARKKGFDKPTLHAIREIQMYKSEGKCKKKKKQEPRKKNSNVGVSIDDLITQSSQVQRKTSVKKEYCSY